MKQINLLKEKTKELLQNKSENYVKVFFDFLEETRAYFKKQSFFYINSLSKYPELKKSADEDFLKKIKPLFEKIFKLGKEEELKRLNENLEKYGYFDYVKKDDIFINNLEAVKYAEQRAGEFIEGINETTQKQISAIISTGIKESKDITTIASEINNVFLNYSLYRATLIAQQETAMAYSTATRKMVDSFAEDLGVDGWKRAITQKDSNVRDSHRENEAEGRIPKKQVFGTGHDNVPFGYFCRCDVSYSLVNPETGKLYENEEIDFWGGYTDEQVNKFDTTFRPFQEEFMNLWDFSGKTKQLQEKYKMNFREITIYRLFAGWTYHNLNSGFFGEKDIFFEAGIKFMFGFINKLPKYKGKIFRGHKAFNLEEFEYLDNLKIGDFYQNKHFFSSSKSKKIAIDFINKEDKGAVLFEIISKKAKFSGDFSINQPEKELLFLPNQLFKVEKIDFFENNGKIYKKIILSDLN